MFFAPGEEIHPGPGLRPAGCRGCGWWRFHPLRLSCACMQCSHSLEVHCDGASGDVQYLAGQAEPRTAGITARCARSGEHAPGDYITENLNDGGESGTGPLGGKRDGPGKRGVSEDRGKAGQVRYWQCGQAEKSPDLAISDLSRFLPLVPLPPPVPSLLPLSRFLPHIGPAPASLPWSSRSPSRGPVPLPPANIGPVLLPPARPVLLPPLRADPAKAGDAGLSFQRAFWISTWSL